MLTFKEVRELMFDAWGIAFVVWSAITFHAIYTVGYARFYEDNSWILNIEIVIAFYFGVLAIERLIEDFITILKAHDRL